MYWIKVHQTALKFSLDKRKQTQMGALLTIIACLIVYVHAWDSEQRNLYLILSFIPVIISLILPSALQIILYVWMIIGLLLGDLIGTLVISLIYLIFITPISLFIKKKNSSGWIKKKSSNIDLDKMY